MNKAILYILLNIFSTHCAHSQTFDEWFRQKKTRIRYLVEQIAAYEVFDADVAKGYGIAQSGLGFIGDTTAGELALHTAYYRSLETVNPSVAGYARIAAIMSMASAIVEGFGNLAQVPGTTGAESDYLGLVSRNLIAKCNSALDELAGVLTYNDYTMTDDQRIRRIDALYASVADQYAFSQSFLSEVKLLAGEREVFNRDIQESIIDNGVQLSMK
ncbi:MAG TPA: hypothetical protein VKR32_15855 [Puia sp.]|nr:hypothetical protein [Puia sp.]